MDGQIVSVQNFIVFGFTRSYFAISPTRDGNVYIGIKLAHKSLS